MRTQIKLTNGAKLIASQQFPHPKDNYLYHVLAEFNGQFVTWVHNSTCGGCYEGGYFKELARASEDFFQRVDNQWGPAFVHNLKGKMEVTE